MVRDGDDHYRMDHEKLWSTEAEMVYAGKSTNLIVTTKICVVGCTKLVLEGTHPFAYFTSIIIGIKWEGIYYNTTNINIKLFINYLWE